MKVESAFVCDDVRQEGNGKYIFIGAYAQDIILPTIPMGINLQVVLCLRYEKPNTFGLDIEAFLDDKRQLKGSLTVTNIAGGFGYLHFPLLIPRIESPATLKVRVREGEENWNEVVKVYIKTATAVAPASDSPPPS